MAKARNAKHTVKKQPKPTSKSKQKTKPIAAPKQAPKRKAKAKTPESLAQMRGVANFDANEIILLVHAPIDQVTEAFKKHKKAKLRQKDVAGKQMTLSDPCYLLYQLAGHPWTVVDAYVCHITRYPTAEDAKALSKSLRTKAIYYGNSDTAGATGYDLFENGKRLEHFMCFEEIEFESELGRTAPPDGPEIYDFVNAFMREQDAFAPSWSTYLGGWREEAGSQATMPFGDLGSENLVRLDFVAV